MIDAEKVKQAVIASESPISAQQLARRFKIKSNDRRILRRILGELEEKGAIVRVRGKSYVGPSNKTGKIIGRLQVTARGFGFVRPDSALSPVAGADLFISARDMADALDGDLVRAVITNRGHEGLSGRIESVVERAHTTVVGWYQRHNDRYAEVIPRNSKLDRRIRVPIPSEEMNLRDFDWVSVEIQEYTRAPDSLLGKVISRIGQDGDRGIDVLLVLRDRGIVEEFSAAAMKEAEALDFDWNREIPKRADLRKLPTITIDPKTAKDFDDALSIEKLSGDTWRLYVHIADVAHFLKIDSALDTEAAERSTSVYPVDRVVPMLPERISNYLCSLVPGEDRLAMTAIMDINRDGKIVASKFENSVIYSDYRFHYAQVQEFYDAHDAKKELTAEQQSFAEHHGLLLELRNLARILRKMRMQRGALDLDIPQLQVIFDEAGKVSDLQFYPRYEANQVIEECMLIANEAVATHLNRKDVPILYRVHEMADPERLEKLEPVLKYFGIRLGKKDGKITPLDIQKALETAEAHPAGHIVRKMILRALKRAEYSPENVGHFGLASELYCHFTSPIRRYPDVVVHRQLKSVIAKEPLVYGDEEELFGLGEHTSQRERRAQEAEWEAIAIKSLEFMKQFEGEEVDGYISSVQSFGFFVELKDHPVEGLVKKASLRGDQFDLDDSGIKLVGRRTGRSYTLTDLIRVKIDKVDVYMQQLDLSVVEDQKSAPKAFGKRAKPKAPGKKGSKKRR